MRSILLAAAMIFASTVALGAPAQQAAAPVGSTPASKALDPNERICKDILSGSRIAPKRICATRAEWAEREREDKDATQLIQRPIQTCNIMGTMRC